MDDAQFDVLTRRLGRLASRRGVLGVIAAAGSAVAASAPAAAKSDDRSDDRASDSKTKRKQGGVTPQGPCGNGGKKANKCHKDEQCCTGYCKKKKKLCRCKKTGQSCTDTTQCCPSKTGNSCQNDTCQPAPDCDVCLLGCPFTFIQDAINEANPGDTIRLCATTYVENFTIDKDLTLAGADTAGTILKPEGAGSVISIAQVTVEIKDLTIQDGNTTDVGGGISNGKATTTLTRVNLTGNHADLRGGAIDINTDGSVTLNECDLTGNSAGTVGGGVNLIGTLIVGDGTSITGNTAGDSGGGIQTGPDGTTTIEDGATVKDNDPDDCSTADGGTLNGTCPTP